jgi:hypothetical protein
MRQNRLVGKKIVAVHLAEDKKAIKFDIEGADPIIARADGDCCSSTWIETVETPENLLGTVTAVEDIDMPKQPYDEDKYECISFYGCKISTDKGSCLLDYRNESNGYYGGNLDWGGKASYFYGGVFGQNISNEDWQQIVPPSTRTKETK